MVTRLPGIPQKQTYLDKWHLKRTAGLPVREVACFDLSDFLNSVVNK